MRSAIFLKIFFQLKDLGLPGVIFGQSFVVRKFHLTKNKPGDIMYQNDISNRYIIRIKKEENRSIKWQEKRKSIW